MSSHALDIPADLLASPSFQLERLRRRTRDRVEAVLAAENTTLRSYWVLTCLTADDASSQATLCSILGMDASDMVRLLDTLEDQGWAKRTRNPKDRRRQIVAATKKGRNAQKRLSALVSQAEDTALEESTPKQLKHLRKLAQAIFAAEEA